MVDVQREGLEQMRVRPGIGVSPGVKERVVQLLFLLLDQPQSVFLIFFFVAGERSGFLLPESPSEFFVVLFLVAGESSRFLLPESPCEFLVVSLHVAGESRTARLGVLLGIYTQGMSR